MVKRDEIIKFINDYLQIDKWPEDVNGLVVPGKDEIQKIVTEVSPSLQLFKMAKERDAQLAICHHYLHLEETVPSYEEKRIEYLKANELGFANYHLPLDFHSEIGNSALTIKQFGFELSEQKFYVEGYSCGGLLSQPVTLDWVIRKAEEIYGDKPFVLGFGPEKVENIAVVTGSAHSMLDEVSKAGARTVIMGSVKESTQEAARELGLNVIACGHYNTEKVGIKALGELVAGKFGIEQEFVDIPNRV